MAHGRLNGRAIVPGDTRPSPVLDVIRGDDVATVVLGGELDLRTVPSVRLAVEDELERRPRWLVVDLAAVHFLDSSGLHFLLATHRRLSERGSSLVLVSPSPVVRRIFEVGGLHRALTFEDGPNSQDSTEPAPFTSAQ